MQKKCRHIFSILLIVLSGIFAFAQEAEYKDVVLDGKPAKLNLKTGKITFVNPKDQTKPIKLNNVVAVQQKDSLKQSANTTNDIFGYHVVQEGETLLDISKHYNVPLSKLKELNNLESTLVSKGQVLKVKKYNLEINKDSQTELKTIEKPKSKDIGAQFHMVKKGETLFSLAKRYDLSLKELKNLNSLSSNLISVGQKLQVRKSEVEQAIQTSVSDSVWIVSKGDTLYSIAKKNGLTLDELKALNGLTSNTIIVGQKLRIN